MATAKRLPSGSWRCRAKKVIDGQTVTKSFTVSPDDCVEIPKKPRQKLS